MLDLLRRRLMMGWQLPWYTFTLRIPANEVVELSFGSHTRKAGWLQYVDFGDGQYGQYKSHYNIIKHTYNVLSEDRNVTVTVIGKVWCLEINNKHIISVDVSNNIHFESIRIENPSENGIYGELERLDVTKNPLLKKLHVYGTKIKNIDLTKNPLLNDLIICTKNSLENLNISSNSNLECCYISHHNYEENLVETVDIRPNRKLTQLFVYTDSLKHIDGLEDVDYEINDFQITKSSHYLDQSFDLRKLKMNKYGLLTLATTGQVQINALVNNKRTYNQEYKPSESFHNWKICANPLLVTFDDGYVADNRKDFFTHLAQIVSDRGLYDYPQHHTYRTLGVTYQESFNESRDLYESAKILFHDSHLAITWNNFKSNSWQGSMSGDFGSLDRFTRSMQYTTYVNGEDIYPKDNIFKLRLVFLKDAKFFFKHRPYGYGVFDEGKPRLLYENETLTPSGELEILERTENGEEVTVIFTVKVPIISYYANRMNFGVFESSYPEETDPYVSKVKEIIWVDARN